MSFGTLIMLLNVNHFFSRFAIPSNPRAHRERPGDGDLESPDEPHHPCSYCGRAFSSEKYLQKHRVNHCPEAPDRADFSCDLCPPSSAGLPPPSFPSSVALRRHLRKHRDPQQGDPSFACGVCFKGFASASILRRHVAIHTGRKDHRCHLCDTSFDRVDKLKRHLSAHGEKEVPCPFARSLGCEERFWRRDKAKEHAETAHGR